MSSNSKSDTQSTSVTEDSRVLADGEAIAIGRGSDVVITEVADEAFDLADDALTFSSGVVDRVLDSSEQMVRRSEGETKQLMEQAIKYGLPVLAVAYVAARVLK